MKLSYWILAAPTIHSIFAAATLTMCIAPIGLDTVHKNKGPWLAAHGDWILSLDADEWVRNHLRQDIQQAIKAPEADGFYIPRLTMYCGQFQKYGDAAKDKVLRLFRRDKGHFTDDIVHEKVICEGRIGCLHSPLLHNAYRTEQEWAAQMHHYALLTAQLRHAKGRRSHPPKAWINGYGYFFVLIYGVRGFAMAAWVIFLQN